MPAPKLAGLAEVAQLLGVSKRTALTYTGRSDFPKPLERLASGPIWSTPDVLKWGKATLPLPPGRPSKPGPDRQ
jgi:hypothetical protein